MISTINSKWNTKDGLRDIVETNPNHVSIDGMRLPENVKWSGYVSQIPYGATIMVKHQHKTFGFAKRTDGTIKVI